MNSSTRESKPLILKGRLTIANSREILEKLRKLFDNTENLKLYLYENTEIDLAFLQILLSLLEASHRGKRKLSVFIDDPNSIQNIIKKAGLEANVKLIPDPKGNDFIIEGRF